MSELLGDDNKQDRSTEKATVKGKGVKSPGLSEDHTRRTHRLDTARYTIYGSLGAILVLAFLPLISVNHFSLTEDNKEILRDAILVFSTIATLALGFIAGSHIE